LYHRQHILDKLSVSNMVELMQVAERIGITPGC